MNWIGRLLIFWNLGAKWKVHSLIFSVVCSFSIPVVASGLSQDTFKTAVQLSDSDTHCEKLARSFNGLFFIRYQVMEDKKPRLLFDCPVTSDFHFSVYSRTPSGWKRSNHRMDLTPFKVGAPSLLINQAKISEDGRKLMIMMDSPYIKAPWIAVGPITTTMAVPIP